MMLTITGNEILGAALVLAPLFFGWVLSVERRITKLVVMAEDIHVIREAIEKVTSDAV